jgi:hypothetical protein
LWSAIVTYLDFADEAAGRAADVGSIATLGRKPMQLLTSSCRPTAVETEAPSEVPSANLT